MSDKQVRITIEYSCWFSIDEVWPDGDAPEVVTTDAVLARLRAHGLDRVPSDWNFPRPLVHIDLSGLDSHGRTVRADALWTGKKTVGEVWQ